MNMRMKIEQRDNLYKKICKQFLVKNEIVVAEKNWPFSILIFFMYY